MPRVPESPGVSVLEEGRLGYASFDPTPIDTGFVQQQKETNEAFRRHVRVRGEMQKQQDAKLERLRKEDEAKREKMLQEAREARASDAANRYYRSTIRKMTGKGGALTKQAADVVSGYNGKNYVDGYMGEFNKDAQDIASSLDDPETRDMYFRKVAAYDNQFTSMLAGHEGRETIAYAINSANEDTAIALEMAATSTDFTQFAATVERNERRIADLQGIDVNSPGGKAYVRRKKQEKMGYAVAKAAEHFVNNNDFARAKATVVSAVENEIINGDAATKISRAISEQETAHDIDVKGKFVADEISKQWEEADTVLRSATTEAQGWIKDFAGEDGTYSGAEALLYECGTADNMLVAASFATREEFETARDEAEKKYGKNATYMNMLEFNERAKNNYARVKRRYETARETFTMPRDEDILAAVKQAAPYATPEVQMKMMEGAKSHVQMRVAQRDVDNAATLTNLEQWMRSGEPIDRASFDFSGLSGSQRRLADAWISRYERSETNVPNDRLYYELLHNPARLSAMSETDWKLMHAHLSDLQFAELDEIRSRRAGKPPKGISTDMLSTALNFACARIGVSDTLKDQRKKALLREITFEHLTRINAELAPGGGTITQEQANEYAYQLLNEKVGYDNSWFSPKPLRVVDITEAKQLPDEIVRFITTVRSDPDMSDDAKVNWFHRMYLEPMDDWPDGAIDPNEVREIVEAYIGDPPKRPVPDKAIIKRIFFAKHLRNNPEVRAIVGDEYPNAGRNTASAAYSNVGGDY